MLVRVTAEPVRVAATVTVSLGASEPFIPAPGGSRVDLVCTRRRSLTTTMMGSPRRPFRSGSA
mgnify:CR=1 FL=1